jgi:protoporphyrinogen oxidase
MRIGIIGAGISGLSLSRLLKDYAEVEILELGSAPGGIARPKVVNGIPYHTTGGHCYNSKNEKVMDFIFSVLPKEEWHKVNRNAKILFRGHMINYPIEFSVKEIAKFDIELASRIIEDFLTAQEREASDLEEIFKMKFGKTLAEEYLIPFNKKIWARDLREISPHWIKGKLPTPDKMAFLRALFSEEKDTMPHTTFYYPNSNTGETFIDALAKESRISYNYNVRSIEKIDGKWTVNKEKIFDILVSTMPLKNLPQIISNVPKEVTDAADKLRYNTVSNILWEVEPYGDVGWTYLPSGNTKIHKYTQIGNFLRPQIKNYATTEMIGKISEEEMVIESKKEVVGLIKPVAHNNSEMAYVVYDKNYDSCVRIIKEFIKETGLETLGRFGEWTYYNMDDCIENAMRMAEKIINKYSLSKHNTASEIVPQAEPQ